MYPPLERLLVVEQHDLQRRARDPVRAPDLDLDQQAPSQRMQQAPPQRVQKAVPAEPVIRRYLVQLLYNVIFIDIMTF
jgi:hypothetical protein